VGMGGGGRLKAISQLKPSQDGPTPSITGVDTSAPSRWGRLTLAWAEVNNRPHGTTKLPKGGGLKCSACDRSPGTDKREVPVLTKEAGGRYLAAYRKPLWGFLVPWAEPRESD